jgi:hypothetical protein
MRADITPRAILTITILETMPMQFLLSDFSPLDLSTVESPGAAPVSLFLIDSKVESPCAPSPSPLALRAAQLFPSSPYLARKWLEAVAYLRRDPQHPRWVLDGAKVSWAK